MYRKRINEMKTTPVGGVPRRRPFRFRSMWASSSLWRGFVMAQADQGDDQCRDEEPETGPPDDGDSECPSKRGKYGLSEVRRGHCHAECTSQSIGVEGRQDRDAGDRQQRLPESDQSRRRKEEYRCRRDEYANDPRRRDEDACRHKESFAVPVCEDSARQSTDRRSEPQDSQKEAAAVRLSPNVDRMYGRRMDRSSAFR